MLELSVWEEHINQVKEGEFFTITDCKLRFYYGKCLSTMRTTTVAEAVKQDVVATPKNGDNIICCPEILNVSVHTYPICNNKECKKKINGNPGSRLVKCLACNRSMLIKNCYFDLNANFQLQTVEDKTVNVTAFANQDVYLYRDNVDDLIEKLLVLESTDFHISQNGRLVSKIEYHQ